MKMDKETVIKHQFWFLLGTYVLVWFIAVLWLKIAAGGPIEDAKKKYKTAEDGLKSASQDPKNPNTFCPPWDQYADQFDGHKHKIWTEAWELQKGIYDWPAELRNKKNADGSVGMVSIKTELTPDELTRYR